MKIAVFIFCVLAVLFGFFLFSRQQRRKRIERFKQNASLRTFEPDGDPFSGRVEFHSKKPER